MFSGAAKGLDWLVLLQASRFRHSAAKSGWHNKRAFKVPSWLHAIYTQITTIANRNQFKRLPILMDLHISRRTWSSSLSHAGEAAPAREHCPPRYALPGWRTCLTSPRISGTCPPGLQQGGRSRLEQLQTKTKRAHRVSLLCCKQCLRFSNRKLGLCGLPTEMAVVLL